MDMGSKKDKEVNVYTRRVFLGKASLSMAVGAVFLTGARSWLGFWKQKASGYPQMPEDSIFRPRNGPGQRG